MTMRRIRASLRSVTRQATPFSHRPPMRAKQHCGLIIVAAQPGPDDTLARHRMRRRHRRLRVCTARCGTPPHRHDRPMLERARTLAAENASQHLANAAGRRIRVRIAIASHREGAVGIGRRARSCQ